MLAFFALALSLALACFNSDPGSILKNDPIVIPGGGGSFITIVSPGWGQWDGPAVSFSADVTMSAAFPYTLNFAFSGFVNEDGTADTDIKRIILFYYAPHGEWTILRDIKNPSFTVVTDTSKALFGRHCIPSALGYSKGSAIPVVPYFASENNESFDLEAFLAAKHSLGAASAVNALTIALVVSDNRIAH